MTFPLSPANNQVTLENGISYTYNASRGAWFRTPATALTSLTSNTFTVLNSIIFSDGTSQTSAPTNIDSFARSTANTNSNNITILQGVNTDQNTRITIAEGVDVSQNTRMSIIEGVDNTQNTNITIATNAATAAFAQANATAGGLTTANARITITEGVDLWQNTQITNISSLAQGAFNQANTAGGADTFARQTANAAFTQANTATTLAQAAFNKANTSDAVLTSTVDRFTGNGSNTAFTLSVAPATINYTIAVVGGVTQPRSEYSVVGTTLTFTSAPSNGQIVEITTIGTSNTTLYTVNNIISPFLLMGA